MNAHIQGLIRRLKDPELVVAKDDQRAAAILVEQLDLMERLIVVPYEDGLTIDTSAITDDRHYPTRWFLLPNADGTWTHPQSATTGSLSDHMRGLVSASQDRAPKPGYGDDGRLALTPAGRRALDHAIDAEETLDYHDHQPAGDNQ